MCITAEFNYAKSKPKTKNLIVSFTSYGVRLKKCTWLTVYSMLMQSQQAEVVILYLDYSFQNIKLPFLMRKLVKMGLQIKYCSDIKSYKKLVPALTDFSDKIIITIDDDIYYSKNLLKNLYETYLENPKSICATAVRIITFDTSGVPATYKQWEKAIDTQDTKVLFAVGYGGVLYPPSIFDLHHMDEKQFMSICPTADDIWFFAVRYSCHISLAVANKYKITYYPVNYLYERLHKNSGLTDANVFEGKNDSQLQAAIKHFNIKFNLNNIKEKV